MEAARFVVLRFHRTCCCHAWPDLRRENTESGPPSRQWKELTGSIRSFLETPFEAASSSPSIRPGLAVNIVSCPPSSLETAHVLNASPVSTPRPPPLRPRLARPPTCGTPINDSGNPSQLKTFEQSRLKGSLFVNRFRNGHRETSGRPSR